MAQPKILYENRFKDATPVASTTATGYDVLNLRDFRPYTWWKATALPATVTVNCGSAKAADYAVVWGHDLYSNACTVEIRGSTDNFSASDVLVATRTPTSDSPFVMLFNSVSYQYWRIKITGAAGIPTIAIAAVGARLDVPSYLDEGFDPVGREAMGQFNRSEKGHPLGKLVQFEEWRASMKFPVVTWTWLRASFDPAWRAWLRSAPFVFAWDTDNYAAELFLVQAEDKFETPHHAGGYADLQIEVFGVMP